MCTVIITVPDDAAQPVRLLAVRDEDPGRPWDRLGAWWPDRYPGVVGIRDVRAGGAWLAANTDERRLAVLLNRHDLSDRRDDHQIGSLPQGDVPDLRDIVVHRGGDRMAADRLPRGDADEAHRVVGRDHVDLMTVQHEQPYELHGLVGGDPARHSDDDVHASILPRRGSAPCAQ